MKAVRVELAEANQFIASAHRHHKPVQGHRFSIGVEHNGRLCGVAICGRPVARKTDQKHVLEVTRCCTDGTKNACSYLYGAAARVAKELGFSKVQTFILEGEEGSSLEAAGYKFDGVSEGGNWNVPTRGGRREDQPQCAKKRFVRNLS